MTSVSRRELIATAAALGGSIAVGDPRVGAAESGSRFDFTQPLDSWETVTGNWTIGEVPGSSSGKALVQRATNNDFNVIVAPGGPYFDVDITVRFKPISGREDASGGIVFRFIEGRYYVIRANALEDNFNFYYYDRGRREIAGAHVKAPTLGQWHKLRVTAERDHIKGWLNDRLLIDRHDSRFASGRVGLWTKADSITAFDELVIAPVSAS